MKCQARNLFNHLLCTHTAKVMVIAPGAPKVVCGHHARAYVKECLFPLKFLGKDVNLVQLPDINGFLDSVKRLGIEVSVNPPVITISFGGTNHGQEA